LRKLLARRDQFDFFWGGHGSVPLSPDVISQGLDLCDKIIKGVDEAIPGGTRKLREGEIESFYAKQRTDDLSANIAYRKDRIHEAPPFRRFPVNG
jgi:hypothetical protein